jgi:hypothetical protein
MRRLRGGFEGWALWWALWCALFSAICGGVLGCSSSDDQSPSQICEQFVSSYCDMGVSCAQ